MKVFVLSILFLVSWTSADPHHEPRHDGEEDDTKVAEQSVIDNSDVDLEENTEVRHHIYMPYPLAYRQSAHPPTIQYVPHYRQHSALPVPPPPPTPVQYVPVTVDQIPRFLSPAGYPADPRFISLNLGTYADLGFASVGANTALDGNKGQFSAGAGVGTGSQYAHYGQYGVTKIPQSSTVTSQEYPYYVSQSRAAVVPQPPQVVPQVAPRHPHFAPVYGPRPVNYAFGNQAPRAAPTVFYPIYL